MRTIPVFKSGSDTDLTMDTKPCPSNPVAADNDTKTKVDSVDELVVNNTNVAPTDHPVTVPAIDNHTSVIAEPNHNADDITDERDTASNPRKRKATESRHSRSAAKRIRRKKARANEDASSSEDKDEDTDVETGPAATSSPDAPSIFGPIGSIFGGIFASPLRKRKADDAEDPVACKRSKIESELVDANMEVVADKALDSTKFKANPDVVSFLTLPAEIRLRIYGYLFGSKKTIILKVKPDTTRKGADDNRAIKISDLDRPRWDFRQGVLTTLACANKQLSREVLHFLYSTRTFTLTLPQHRAWINQIGHANSSLVKHIVLSCKGRPKTAGDHLFTTLVTLRKRGFESLKTLTLYDNGLSVESGFFVKQLLEFGEKQGWKAFHQLGLINIIFPHPHPPNADKPLYEQLCLQSKAKVTSKFFRAAPPVSRRRPQIPERLIWLSLDPVKLEEKQKTEEEAKREINRRRKQKLQAVMQEKEKAKKQRWVKARTAALHATFESVQKRYQETVSAKADVEMEGVENINDVGMEAKPDVEMGEA